jgi:hypothetical protein
MPGRPDVAMPLLLFRRFDIGSSERAAYVRTYVNYQQVSVRVPSPVFIRSIIDVDLSFESVAHTQVP